MTPPASPRPGTVSSLVASSLPRSAWVQVFVAGWIATLVILAATIWGFIFYAPLTYGTPGLDVAA